jgi:hypothetical protein
MSHHEENGHGQSHDHDTTEGNRQYYPQGWWIPLAGLTVVALGLIYLGGFSVGLSGTDKWGKSTGEEIHGSHGGDHHTNMSAPAQHGAEPHQNEPIPAHHDSATGHNDGSHADSLPIPAHTPTPKPKVDEHHH